MTSTPCARCPALRAALEKLMAESGSIFTSPSYETVQAAKAVLADIGPDTSCTTEDPNSVPLGPQVDS